MSLTKNGHSQILPMTSDIPGWFGDIQMPARELARVIMFVLVGHQDIVHHKCESIVCLYHCVGHGLFFVFVFLGGRGQLLKYSFYGVCVFIFFVNFFFNKGYYIRNCF